MAFRINYCKVVFDNSTSQWYNTGGRIYPVGTDLIVPINDRGIYSIGTVCESRKYKSSEVPADFYWCKSHIKKAGNWSDSYVKRHNKKAEKRKSSIVDISVAHVDTANGKLCYVTCRKERDLLREYYNKQGGMVILENYPAVSKKSIPPEARKVLDEVLEMRRIEARARQEEKQNERAARQKAFEAREEFEDLMEDLDNY